MVAVTREDALSLCASPLFAERLSAGGPYRDFEVVVEAARAIWWGLPVTEWLSAFSAHPEIGDNKAVESKPAAFGAFSRSEQAAAASSASADVVVELAAWNQKYYDKFGFIFIICARGKSSPEILAALKERYARLPYEEVPAAAKEQMAITELRLGGLLGLSAEAELQARTQRRADQLLQQLAAAHASGPLRSPITTHVLDQALGGPAPGVPLSLLKLDEHSRRWDMLGKGVTNSDGRVGNLLAPGNYVAPGRYRMHFDTATYLAACKASHPGFYSDVPFYPEVCIDFEITSEQATQHYHIPLLLAPYGYSTYRGS